MATPQKTPFLMARYDPHRTPKSRSRLMAAFDGRRLPCSQSCRVLGLIPRAFANWDWERRFIDLRRLICLGVMSKSQWIEYGVVSSTDGDQVSHVGRAEDLPGRSGVEKWLSGRLQDASLDSAAIYGTPVLESAMGIIISSYHLYCPAIVGLDDPATVHGESIPMRMCSHVHSPAPDPRGAGETDIRRSSQSRSSI